MKNVRANSSQRGFTLIELMIAMLIGVFLMAGVIQIFLSAKQAYRLQENLSRLQENGRFAMDFLTKGIRMAGYSGCASRVPLTVIADDTDKLPAIATAINGLNNINYSNSAHVLCNASGWQCLPDTDLISFQSSGSCGGSISDINNNAASLKVAAPNECNLEKGDVVIIADCSAATAFGVSNNPKTTSNNGSQTVTHGGNENIMLTPSNKSDLQCPDIKSKLCSSYSPGSSEMFVSKSMSYFIRVGAGGVPALWSVNPAKKDSSGNPLQPEELIEGIENMQVLYGVDTDATPDYVPNYYVPANPAWVAADWAKVVSVRINLLAVTIENNLTDEPQPYTYDGTTVTKANLSATGTKAISVVKTDTSQLCPPAGTNCQLVDDRRIHRVFSSTIAVRNRLP